MLRRRKSLRRILALLVERRGHDALDPDQLFAAGWEGERASPESARHRVYVAVSTLRKLGLGDVVQRWEDGYWLDPERPIVIAAP